MAVNEAEHTTGIVWKVRREEGLRRCEEGVTVVRWCCHTHTGNKVSSCVGRVVHMKKFRQKKEILTLALGVNFTKESKLTL